MSEMDRFWASDASKNGMFFLLF